MQFHNGKQLMRKSAFSILAFVLIALMNSSVRAQVYDWGDEGGVADDADDADEAKEDGEVKTERPMTIQLRGNLLLSPVWEMKFPSGNSLTGDCDFSGGVNLGIAYYFVEFMALGFETDFNIWNVQFKDGNDGVPIDFIQFSIGPSLRLGIPVDEAKSFEIYTEFATGWSFHFVNLSGLEEKRGKYEIIFGEDAQTGWNIKALGGLKYRIGNFAMYAEAGYYMTDYLHDEEVDIDVDGEKRTVRNKYNFTLSSAILGIGIIYHI